MIDWLIGFSLLFLVMTHAHLTYSCFKVKPWLNESINDINGSFSHAKNDFSTDFSELSHVVNHGVELIDELVQVLADATPSKQVQGAGLMEVFLSSLMNKKEMGVDYGPTQNDRWKVQENDIPPTLETENEPN